MDIWDNRHPLKGNRVKLMIFFVDDAGERVKNIKDECGETFFNC